MTGISGNVRIYATPGGGQAGVASGSERSTAPRYVGATAIAAFTMLPSLAAGMYGGARLGAMLGPVGRMLGGVAGAAAGATLGLSAARFIGSQLAHRDGPATQPAGQMPDRSAQDGSARPERVRVMTLNMHGGMGPGAEPTEASLEALARQIEQEDPDIVLLQEVDDFAMRSAWRDQAGWLVRRLAPSGAAFASSGTMVTGRQQGEMVLAFHGFSVDAAQNIASPDPYGNGVMRRIAAMVGQVGRFTGIVDHPGSIFSRFSPRNSVDALIRTPGGHEIRAVSTHVAGTLIKDGIGMQVQPIVDALAGWNGPALVGGDFNAGDATAAGKLQSKLLGGAGLQDAFTSAGIALGDPQRASVPGYANGIDRIHVSDDFAVQDVHVVAGAGVSDHDPVVATLTLD